MLCEIKNNCNKLSKQIEVIKEDPKAYTNNFFLKEVKSVKEVSMDLQQYCSELEKVFKQKHNSDTTVNAITSTKSVKQKKWQCKICYKSYIAMNLLTKHK